MTYQFLKRRIKTRSLKRPVSGKHEGSNSLNMTRETEYRKQNGHHQRRSEESQLEHIRVSVHDQRKDGARKNKTQTAYKKNDVSFKWPFGHIEGRIMSEAFPVAGLNEDDCDQKSNLVGGRCDLLEPYQMTENRDAIPKDERHSRHFDREKNKVDNQARPIRPINDLRCRRNCAS